MTRVTIFGATGAQGAPVVDEALAKGLLVRAVARDADKVAEKHPRAAAFSADLKNEDAIAMALDGVDAAFLHLPMPSGPDDARTWMGAYMKAAYRVTLPLMVYTTGGPTGGRYPSSTIIDAATQSLEAVRNSGIPAIALQPAIYLENLLPAFFLPKMRTEGIVDYPPVRESMRVQWTSHIDQARIAVAALRRPDLAGQAFEIGSPGPLTGPELAVALGRWVGRDLAFAPGTAAEFGALVGEVLNNPDMGFALADIYGALAKMEDDAMVVDTDALQTLFDVKLTSAVDHIATWAGAEE